MNLGFIFLTLGSIIGAGFASGKEIESFFSFSGSFSFISIILASIFLFLTIKNLTDFAKFTNAKTVKEVDKLLFKNSKFFDIFIFCGLFVFLTTMIAGINSIGELVFPNINFPILSIISIFFSIFIVLCGIKTIKKLNLILMPVVILFILFVSIFSIFSQPSVVVSGQNLSIFSCFKYVFLALIYVCLNIVFSSSLIFEKGAEQTKKQAKNNAIIISIIFFVLIFCVNLAMLCCKNSSDMPMLFLALNINKTVGYLFSLVLWFAVLTTLISSLYMLTNSLKINKFLSCCLFLTLAFIFSFFGFSTVINFIYPFEGAICLIFISKIFIFNAKFRLKTPQKSLKKR